MPGKILKKWVKQTLRKMAGKIKEFVRKNIKKIGEKALKKSKQFWEKNSLMDAIIIQRKT